MKTILIDELILLLETEKQNGGKTIEYSGTLLVPENGNKILVTTEKQI
jgi:hypothetical protein